ncbi:MAG: nodulation protein NfeD [Candidatus Marinimicrobia bacterium]|nr:nodulation protein NfeD [Candidatus Neomarinimicrobiota bacterium]
MNFLPPIRAALCATVALLGPELSAQVYTVPIQGTIDLGLPPFVERVIALAAKEQPDLIIFDIDTFGGRIDGATRIKDAIMESPVPTIAFINRRAISAGALISLACDQIIMTSGATIGAATAVDLQGNKASEKVISYMREEMSATAEARGRPSRLAEAMVDEDIEIEWLIIKGDSVSLAEVEGGRKGKLVTLTTEKAIRLGMADGTFESIEELLRDRNLQDAAIISFSPSWSERMVRFLTDPVVSSLLMSLGIMGLIFEIRSPGFGVGGIIGVTALSLFFGASFMAELATITEVLFFVTGLILILLEVFVIPGFGVAGVSGIGLMLWGMFKMMLGEYPSPEQMEQAFLGLNIGIIGAIMAIILMLRMLFTSRLFKEMAPITSPDYTVSVGLESLVGQQGVTLTPCMPSGKADIGGRQINIMTRGESLGKGVAVEVISVETNVAFVRAVDTHSQETL